MTHTWMRIGLGFIGMVTGIVAVAFYFQWPLVADIWPWTGYYAQLNPYSFYFLSSIAAAICAPIMWLTLSGKMHATLPGAINLLISFVGITVFTGQSYAATPDNTRLLVSTILFAGITIFNGILIWLSRNIPIREHRPLPAPVKYSFVIFAIALILTGGALVLKTPNIMPWNISIEASVVYGWIFLGASVYFMFAVLQPNWENAAGQLIGFLAYDVVLILPFIRHFADVIPEQRLSLTIYTLVVSYSGLLAIFYLFIHPATRLFGAEKVTSG